MSGKDSEQNNLTSNKLLNMFKEQKNLMWHWREFYYFMWHSPAASLPWIHSLLIKMWLNVSELLIFSRGLTIFTGLLTHQQLAYSLAPAQLVGCIGTLLQFQGWSNRKLVYETRTVTLNHCIKNKNCSWKQNLNCTKRHITLKKKKKKHILNVIF